MRIVNTNKYINAYQIYQCNLSMDAVDEAHCLNFKSTIFPAAYAMSKSNAFEIFFIDVFIEQH